MTKRTKNILGKTLITFGLVVFTVTAGSIIYATYKVKQTQTKIQDEVGQTGDLVRSEIKGASEAVKRDVKTVKTAVKEKAKSKYEEWKKKKPKKE